MASLLLTLGRCSHLWCNTCTVCPDLWKSSTMLRQCPHTKQLTRMAGGSTRGSPCIFLLGLGHGWKRDMEAVGVVGAVVEAAPGP